jgi:hypothetical protein
MSIPLKLAINPLFWLVVLYFTIMVLCDRAFVFLSDSCDRAVFGMLGRVK